MSAAESIELRVRESLGALGVVYEIVECDPALADTAAFCEHYRIPPSQSANAILVASRKEPRQYVACLVLADSRLDVNHTVSRLMGVKRLSFATADETVALTGMMVGGVTPFGLPAEVPLYVDRRVMDADWIIVGGGSRSIKVKISPAVFEKMPNATIVEGLAIIPSPVV